MVEMLGGHELGGSERPWPHNNTDCVFSNHPAKQVAHPFGFYYI